MVFQGPMGRRLGLLALALSACGSGKAAEPLRPPPTATLGPR
jgi:hypothetical protein